MITHILLAVDGSEASLQAARNGITLAKSLKARLTALVVTVPWATYFSRELAVIIPDALVPQAEYERQRKVSAAGILQGLESEARDAGIALTSVHGIHEHPYEAVVNEAKKQGCDLIVMASHSRPGLTGALVGSETMAVLAHTGIPVLVPPPELDHLSCGRLDRSQPGN